MLMKTVTSALALCSVCIFLAAGCATAHSTVEKRDDLGEKVQAAIARAKEEDPGLKEFFDEAAGYAVFPTVGKGAIVVGGAYGKGELFEDGKLVGYCDLTQASIGLALGGQAYTEFIFFETKDDLDNFKYTDFTFAAQASAVALKSGASANAKYADGIVVFTMSQAGLMGEASIGGQRFRYRQKE